MIGCWAKGGGEMSDTTTLYEKCIHDRLEAHGKGWHYETHDHQGMRCRKPSLGATEGYHWSDGCPGGRERTGKRIWWCETHDSSSRYEPVDGITHQCNWDAMTAQLDAQNPWIKDREIRCQMAERWLVE